MTQATLRNLRNSNHPGEFAATQNDKGLLLLEYQRYTDRRVQNVAHAAAPALGVR